MNFKKKHKIISGLLIFTWFFLAVNVSAQTKIDFKSKLLYTIAELGPDLKVLTDSVVFFHENSIMYCDSAIFNQGKEIFHAFGNIRIESPNAQGDTVFLYGDTLHYSGILQYAKVRNRVLLVKDSLNLFTDSLDYNLEKNIGYYFNHGTTINGEDTLKSVFGYYYADKNEFFFKKEVEVLNPRFNMYSDTLKHNTQTKISYFLGPTEIISKENYIYCENGWYDHDRDISQFNKNSIYKNKEKRLIGDSLYYDRNKGIGRAFENVIIKDTLQDAYLSGNYCIYFEKTGFSLMTDSALFVQAAPTDTLFLHADTLCSFNDTLFVKDKEPEIYRIIQAYRKVKVFKSDFQAMCDSLVYNFKDSVIQMHYSPVMWSGENQLTADYILIFTYHKEVDRVDMLANSMIISQSDSIRYNQIKGNDMEAYIEDKKLYQVNVNKAGKAIYFVKDDNELLIGVNKIECQDMIIYLENKNIDKIWYYLKPIAKIYPPGALTPTEEKLNGFIWKQSSRPLKMEDVFKKE